jgi:type IV secretion system protein VirB2
MVTRFNILSHEVGMKKILSVFRRAGDAVNHKIYHYAAIGAVDERVVKLGRRMALLGVLGAAAMAVSEPSMAGTTTGLPWESPMDTIKQSLTGPIALAISIIALAAAGAALVFGGELSEFTRKIIMLVMALALLVSGASIMTKLFAASGAIIH